MTPLRWRWSVKGLVFAAVVMARGGLGDQILETDGFTSCGPDSTIQVHKVDIRYNNSNKTVIFDVSGSSTQQQKVSAFLTVSAYGEQIYSNTFNPCSPDTLVAQLCPVPQGNFAASGSQAIPAKYASLVPGIAFDVPDIAAQATLQLKSLDGDQDVACIRSQVTNGKTASVPAVSYVAAGIAAAALVLTGASAALASGSAGLGSAGGTGTPSPSFGEVLGWFQGMAMNGMLSVNYPPVYRSFTKNFAFSTGLIPWSSLQASIDSFRAGTGGNLTDDSVPFLKNATLVYPDGSTATPSRGFMKAKRAFEGLAVLLARGIETSVNATDSGSGAGGGGGSGSKFQQDVIGIQAYVEELSVPKANVFMTVLLVVAIVIAAIAVGILLVKVVLEGWALFGSFPQSLTGFRKHYWGSIGRTITSLILVLYGVWVLYCIFQFTRGDSWAAITLAAVSLAAFTGVLAYFSWRIWSTVRRLKQTEGDASGLYEDKAIWVKYSLFYESYRKQYWWLFVPAIVYMFARGAVIAAGDGYGKAQSIAQLAVEAVMLVLLLWSRPYERRSGNIINIVIQVVRVLSVACILLFVEEFGIAQTTQTIAGVVLIAVQSALTGILAILIAWNAISACCKVNPHRKRRKEMEKFNRDLDTLTPLDARNSLLLDRPETGGKASMLSVSSIMKEKQSFHRASSDRLLAAEEGFRAPMAPSGGRIYRPLTPTHPNDLGRSLVAPNGAGMALRQPTLPHVEHGYAGSYSANQFGRGVGYRGYQRV